MDAPVVVVGGSMAGLRTAEQLRANDWGGPITVLGAEPHPPYNRPPLSKQALTAQWGDVAAWQRALAFRRKSSVSDVDWRLGAAARAVDLESGIVQTSAGAEIAFQGLVVATGLRPRRLPLPGPQRGRHVVRSLDQARALAADLVPGRRAVVVGGGFIGCEVAATAASAGCRSTIVEPLAAPLERAVGADIGHAVAAHHRSRGVRVECGRAVVALHPGTDDPDRVGAVELDDGTCLPSDLVIEAVGSMPNVEWLAGSGLDIDDGVHCDRWLRATGQSTVVASGDVARVANPRFDAVARRVEHWCTPTDTARQAGATLARTLLNGDPGPAVFAPLPSFWSDQHDLRMQSFGVLAAADRHRVVDGGIDDLTRGLTAHFHRGEQLVGVLLINTSPAEHRAQRELVNTACPAPHPETAPRTATTAHDEPETRTTSTTQGS